MSGIGGKKEFKLAALERWPRALVAAARLLAAVALLTAAHLTGGWTQPAGAAEARKTDRVLPVTAVKAQLAAGGINLFAATAVSGEPFLNIA